MAPERINESLRALHSTLGDARKFTRDENAILDEPRSRTDEFLPTRADKESRELDQSAFTTSCPRRRAPGFSKVELSSFAGFPSHFRGDRTPRAK